MDLTWYLVTYWIFFYLIGSLLILEIIFVAMGRFKGVHITSLSAGITFMGLVIILFCVSAERGAWHGDLPMFVTLFIILMNISVTLIILGSIGIHRTKNSKSAHSLEKYFDLYKKKIISKEEFEAKKKQYLS